MENRLELKDICGYLPYGLKVQRTDTKTICIIHIDKLSCFDDESNIMVYLKRGMPDKPILRPISDLTKEITHNGETFIPLEEIAKLAFPSYDWRVDGKYSVEGDTGLWFWFDNDTISFAVDGTITNCVPNQLVLFDKLHSLHFDLRGLIDKGLAIDANTLNEKVYG